MVTLYGEILTTLHWSGTSPFIYHISENNGESAEDK